MKATVAWLMVALMPFHVLAAVYLDVRGPAHFHVKRIAHNDHRHGHYRVAHHHHADSDASVVMVRVPGPVAPFAPREDSGWSGTMLVTVTTKASPQTAPVPSAKVASISLSLPAALFAARLERPPRSLAL